MILGKMILFLVFMNLNKSLNSGMFKTWNRIKLSAALSIPCDCSKDVLTDLCSPVLDTLLPCLVFTGWLISGVQV